MIPSVLLSAAADRVRDLAAAAVPGPWDSALAEVDHAGPYEREMVADCGDSRTADWIAALSPAVAPAIEQMLRDAAQDWDLRSRIFTAESLEKHAKDRRFRGVLAFAHVILGSVPEGTGDTPNE